MIRLESFRAEHLSILQEQKAMSYLSKLAGAGYGEKLEEHAEVAYTVFSEISGDILMCGGITKYWEGRGEAWAIISQECRAEFLPMHNRVKDFLERYEMRRIETTVDCDFEAGHRWARALGFECEAPVMKGYRPNGKDASLYARVRAA